MPNRSSITIPQDSSDSFKMFKKLAFAAILGASYAAIADAAGSCLAQDDNAWAAIGLTVTTNTATDVIGLGTIGAAAGWHESSSGSANAVCAGGAAVAALTGTNPASQVVAQAP